MPQQFLHRPSAYFPHAFGCVAGRNIPIPIPMLLPPASGTQEASPAPCLVSGPSQGSGPPPPLPMHCPNPRLQHLPPFSPNIPCPDSSYLIPTFSSLRSEFSPRAPSQRPFRCQRSQQRHTFLPSIPFSFSPAVDAASTPSCPLFPPCVPQSPTPTPPISSTSSQILIGPLFRPQRDASMRSCRARASIWERNKCSHTEKEICSST